MELQREFPLIAWRVRWVLSLNRNKDIKVKHSSPLTVVFPMCNGDCPDGSLTLYGAHFLRLKKIAKPTRDQLIILLPTDMGLRSGEVASLRIEHIDLDSGNVMVRDSKQYKLFPIPLTYEVAKHIQNLLNEDKRDEGWLILQHERVAWRRGKAITTIGLCYNWHKWARKADIPNWKQYTPTLGRHYFAAWWAHVKKGSLEVLRRIMRHKSLAYTQWYIQSLIFYEDVRAEMQRLQAIPQVSEVHPDVRRNPCIHYEVCKFATERCYCKNFMPRTVMKYET